MTQLTVITVVILAVGFLIGFYAGHDHAYTQGRRAEHNAIRLRLRTLAENAVQHHLNPLDAIVTAYNELEANQP